MLEAARAESMRVRALFGRLGLAVSPTKGQHEPSQRLDDHLGHAVDSTRGLFLLTPRRETQLAAEARSLICLATRERRLVPPRRLAAFAGLAPGGGLADLSTNKSAFISNKSVLNPGFGMKAYCSHRMQQLSSDIFM